MHAAPPVALVLVCHYVAVICNSNSTLNYIRCLIMLANTQAANQLPSNNCWFPTRPGNNPVFLANEYRWFTQRIEFQRWCFWYKICSRQFKIEWLKIQQWFESKLIRILSLMSDCYFYSEKIVRVNPKILKLKLIQTTINSKWSKI
jgi:hypothetical protein